ncbi:esterase family protein [Bacillus sp. 03113]|uniref:alpha/beta hydrolase n=1 Tax=Bacillus sp. 03113 TaxID=2578211 RepID=UPI0011450947|nr:esterase family protein [Bacillus sp. 03113]
MDLKGSIQEIKLISKELGEEIQLLVYLPSTYTPLLKYPVLFAQDGRDYFQMGRLGRTIDDLLAKKEIEPIIVVGIPYKNVEDRRKKYHPSGAQNQAYIRFLAHELVPFIDQKFPTLQIGMGRALIGDSLGATVSLMTALQYPHTFGKVILQSPLVDDKVLTSIKQFKKEPHLLSFYHIIGTLETEVKTTANTIEDFLAPNRILSELIKERKFPYFYAEFEGNHTWKYWQPDLIRALIHMFKIIQ